MRRIAREQRQLLRQWSPAVFAAGVSWLLLVFVGDTPLVRSIGLALAILGVAAGMRPMGFVASAAGGITLALSPVFWSQTGGNESQPALTIVAAVLAAAAMLLASTLLRRRDLGIGIGVTVFLLIFWSQIGTAQSLRLTGLVTAWLLFILVDMILLTNPRPGLKPAKAPKPWHTLGLLFLLAAGAINDPLVVLFAPAIALALLLSYAKLPAWYWFAALLIMCVGFVLLIRAYLLPQSTNIDLLAWREAIRWIELGQLIVQQFSVLGIVLGVIGLARLSRWYPPLGVVTMIAYAAYVFFGLVYFGAHREILLLPLAIIQVMWMTYAVNTFGQWVNKSLDNDAGRWIHIVSAIYFLLPAILLLNIIRS
ncbi:MAG: hypothetical protein OXG78_05185 [Chloroflexi bacterium]|nr:hypothetical protein [Chloroflexota bacterium]